MKFILLIIATLVCFSVSQPVYTTGSQPTPSTPPPPPPPPSTPPPSECTGQGYYFATYKTDLGNFSPYHPYRRDAQYQYWTENPYDLLCVQDVYDYKLKDNYYDNLKTLYPHNYTAPAYYVPQTCSKKCTEEEISYYSEAEPVDECYSENNNDLYPTYVCVGQNYDTTGVKPECNRCLGWESKYDVKTKYETCTGTDTSECKYPWNGAIGTHIYSKYPYEANDWYYYEDYDGKVYSVVYGSIDYPEYGKAHVFCGYIPPNPTSDDPAKKLIDYVKTKVNTGEKSIILGNLNAPKGSPSYNYYKQQNYQPVIDEGCSYCPENTLAVDAGAGEQQDNIWYWPKQDSCHDQAEYFATEPIVTVPGQEDVYLGPNYGVKSYLYSV